MMALVEAADLTTARTEPEPEPDAEPEPSLCEWPEFEDAPAAEDNDENIPVLQSPASPKKRKRKARARGALTPQQAEDGPSVRGKRSAAAQAAAEVSSSNDKDKDAKRPRKNASRIGMKYDTAKKRLDSLKNTIFGEKHVDMHHAAKAFATAFKINLTGAPAATNDENADIDLSKERCPPPLEQEEAPATEAEIEDLKAELEEAKTELALAQQVNSGEVEKLRSEAAAAKATCDESSATSFARRSYRKRNLTSVASSADGRGRC